MESQRQKKISSLIQKEIAELIGSDLRRGGIKNLIISVTKVRVSPDLSLCKVYLSIFPSKNSKSYLKTLQRNGYQIRYDLAQKMKNQLRKIPDLHFYLDDSLDHIERINKELNAGENPLTNLNTLASRQKK